MSYLVGIDIGGTFTDCAIVDRAGRLLTTKVPSTPEDFSRGMMDALGAEDLTTATVRGLHFGGPIAEGEPTGNELAAAEIIAWLAKRHELTPPA